MTLNHTFMNNSHISERFSALIADGVQQFPQAKDISRCKRCIRAEKRKRVLVEHNIRPKKFFVLAEFPDAEDELDTTVFSRNSNTSIILNLLEKLEIASDCHHAFALKCFSSNLLPDDQLPLCVIENLGHEIRIVDPQIILCFGTRAFNSLSQFIMPTESAKFETYRVFEFETKTIDVYLLPTAQELKQYPHWRSCVWSKLVHFKQKKNIAS